MQILINSIERNNCRTAILPILKNSALEVAFQANELDGASIPFSVIEQDLQTGKQKAKELYTPQGLRVVLCSISDPHNLRSSILAARKIAHHHSHLFDEPVLLACAHLEESEQAILIDSFLNGFAQGSYQIAQYQTDKEKQRFDLAKLVVHISATLNEDRITAISQRTQAIAETQLEIFRLVDAPSNKKVPNDIANWALQSGQANGFNVRVMEKPEIEQLGLYALLAVNQASPTPPRFIICEYKPENTEPLPRITMVGKGVTFDTGGLSLKPSNNMHFMKSDMGGAAAVLGTMEVIAKLQLPVHLVVIVPSTDNSIGTTAVKPSDVIQSYSGKTIEIIDTDAEGRLILSDGIAYSLKHHPADTLIDVATLTGSVIRTLGYAAAGLFTNNDQLAEELTAAGQQSGERLWRLPIWEEYGDQMKSDVADIKNFSGKPMAGAITAAKFLQFFTDNHPRWAHLDIAGMAVGDSEFSKQKGATGFGIRLLLTFVESTIQSHSS
ncbi:MAG: leucyl aminopeptidase family protein [Bacteroidota bacterium]